MLLVIFASAAARGGTETLIRSVCYKDGIAVGTHAQRGFILCQHEAEHHLQTDQQRMEIPKESILIDPETYLNRAVVEIDPDRYTLGDLKDANGKILDKQTDPLSSGSTLEITIIDAVGMYDMESGNLGDWNAYSKYSVGWIEPTVVENLASGESVEIIIGSMADTGDAIVIPAAGTALDGPFGEYMLVDLFTDGGVNEYDAAGYGLGDTVGVRIYHINANMERRDVTDIYGDTATIGTINVANAENDNGKYHIELLQAGGDNTFTDLKNLRPNVQPQDFFQTGDVFNAAAYSEFLMDGRMDDGSEFGYTIKVVSIDKTDGSETATIRITRK